MTKKRIDRSISIYSDNIALKSVTEKISKKLGLKITEDDGAIQVIDIDSNENFKPSREAAVKIFTGSLERLRKFLKNPPSSPYDYLILPTEEAEVEAMLNKALHLLKLRKKVDQAVNESLDYYNTFLEMKKSLKILEVSDPDIKTEEILNFLELELGNTSIEIWLYDFDEKTLNLAGFRGTYSPTEKLPAGIKEKFSSAYGPVVYDEGTLIPLVYKGKIFGIIRLKRTLTQEETKKLIIYVDFISIALFNSLKHFYKKRELATYSQRGILKKEILQEFITRNIYQSQRYATPLSFLMFRFDNRKLLEEIFPGVAEKRWNKLISDIAQTLRASDIIGELSPDTYLIILTNTDYMGAIYYLRRFKNILRTHSVFSHKGKTGEIKTSYNIASYPVSGSNWAELEKTLLRGMDQRFSPFFRYSIQNLQLTEAIDYLRSVILRESIRKSDAQLEPKMWDFSEDTLSSIITTFIREMMIQGNRGTGYINLPWFSQEQQLEIIETYIDAGNDRNFPIYFFTNPSTSSKLGYGKKYLITSDSEFLKTYGFIMYLSQWGSYMLIFWKNEGKFTGLHCSDTLLVEEIIEKLQRYFYLKPAV